MSDNPADETPPATDPETPAEAPPPEAIAAAEPTPPTAVDLHVKLGPLQDPDVARPRAAQVWAWALAGGGLAGLLSWMAGESLLQWFPAELSTVGAGPGMSGQVEAASPEALADAATRNAALAFGLLGGLAGWLLGVAGGMVRSSPRSGLAAAVVGSALGVAAGAGVSLAVLPIYAQYQGRPDLGDMDIAYATAALGAVWGALGAAGGLAFGIGMGGWKRGALGLAGGLLGGLLGAAAFEMLGAVAFPLDGTTQPLSTSRESRLAARALAALFISAGVAALVAPTRFEGAAEHHPA